MFFSYYVIEPASWISVLFKIYYLEYIISKCWYLTSALFKFATELQR